MGISQFISSLQNVEVFLKSCSFIVMFGLLCFKTQRFGQNRYNTHSWKFGIEMWILMIYTRFTIKILKRKKERKKEKLKI